MSIKIIVAFCTKCHGYYSSTPEEKNNFSHPDIIDHFFYHGEPWFTLDHDTFEKSKSYENLEIRTLSFYEHIKHDRVYCHCKKKKSTVIKLYKYELKSNQNKEEIGEKYEVDTDIYFKDLYYTSKNFHGLNSGNKKLNWTRC